jgi:hypothetical protein
VAGRDGAVLRTRGRETWLSGDAAVAVLDGARQELRSGLVMVDARRGPGLDVSTPAAVVTTPAGALSRVEESALLRVGTYAGDAVRVRAAGRRATARVSRDYQVQLADGSLPGPVTPLALTAGDAYERALAPDLVAADEALTVVAGRLDAGGRTGTVVAAAFRTDVTAAPVLAADAPASESALPYLLARAAGGGGLDGRFLRAQSLRAAGGSWGVVADLLTARVNAVAALLDQLLAPAGGAVAAPPVDVATALGLPSGAAAAAGGAAPVSAGSAAVPAGSSAPAPGAGSTPPSRGGSGSAPGPAPAPSPAPAPLPLPAPLDAVVATVVGLLPVGSGVLPAPPGGASPSPTPSPATIVGTVTGTVTGVVGGVLGH